MHPLTLDVAECAALLKCGVRTVYELLESGELPGAKIGVSWVVLTSDALEWFKEQASKQRQVRLEKKRPALVSVKAGPVDKPRRPTLEELQALLPA